MTYLLKLGLCLLFLLIAAFFYVKNDQPVVVDLYLHRIELPFVLALVIALLAGVVLTFIINLPRVIKLLRENQQLKKQLKSYGQELDGLRTLPIKDRH